MSASPSTSALLSFALRHCIGANAHRGGTAGCTVSSTYLRTRMLGSSSPVVNTCARYGPRSGRVNVAITSAGSRAATSNAPDRRSSMNNPTPERGHSASGTGTCASFRLDS